MAVARVTMRRTCRTALGVALAAVVWTAAPAAREARPVEAVVHLDSAVLDRPVVLGSGWRYHPGDDPSWAAPDLDDASWHLLSSSLRTVSPGEWQGIGWFRRPLIVDDRDGIVMALRMEQAGASEVFLDGRKIAAFGRPSAEAPEEQVMFPRRFTAVRVPAGEHLLAVRYSNAAGTSFSEGFRGFVVVLRNVDAMSAAAFEWTRAVAAGSIFFTGVFATFAVIHLLLFVFMPHLRENFAFGVFAGVLAGYLTLERQFTFAEDGDTALLLFRLTVVAAVLLVASGIALELVLFRRRPSLSTWVVAGAVAVLAVLPWIRPAIGDVTVFKALVLVGFAEMLRLAVAAMWRRQRDAWIVGAGFIALTGSAVYLQLSSFGVVPVAPDWVFLAGVMSLVVAFSASLAWRLARTTRELEARVLEVESLTAAAIAQERRTARDEAQRQVLEAEHERHRHELEEARRIQLAMLPREPPDLTGFEFAYRMTTANEVGGDYVDVVNGDGSFSLAVGDATSHGLHAGMVVAVAKSMFQAACRSGAPAETLRRIGAGLAAMHERRASMAMAVLRCDADGLRFASAGMPPLLIWRRASGGVEELLLPGVPLATLQDAVYEERSVAVDVGDTLLLMSDGLAEAESPSGELFGYGRVTDAFARLAAGGGDVDSVAEGLLGVAGEHLDGRSPADDITVVVLRAR